MSRTALVRWPSQGNCGEVGVLWKPESWASWLKVEGHQEEDGGADQRGHFEPVGSHNSVSPEGLTVREEGEDGAD